MKEFRLKKSRQNRLSIPLNYCFYNFQNVFNCVKLTLLIKDILNSEMIVQFNDLTAKIAELGKYKD